jgi:hypothetical protein
MYPVQPMLLWSLTLGPWLFISRFMWTHSAAQFTNAGVVSVVYTGVATAALGNPRIQHANSILASWLFVSAWLLPRAADATLWHNLVVSLAMIAIALRTRV